MQSPLDRRDRAALWIRLAIRFSLTALGLLLTVRLGPAFLSLLAPFLLALLTAWALHPPVCWLHRKLGLSRRILSLTTILLCCAAAGGALYALGCAAFVQVRELSENWPAIRQSLLDLFGALSVFFADLSAGLPPILADTIRSILLSLLDWVQAVLPAALDATLEGAGSVMTRLPSFAVACAVFLLACYFITADYPRLRFLAANQLPAPAREFAGNFRRIFREAFGGYLKSQLILSLGVFGILSTGFFLIGQDYGLLIALLLALLDFIPIVGAGTVMIPWAIIELVTDRGSAALALLLIWGIILLFRRFAEPKILGEQTGLSPILSLLGIYVGMRLGGVLGMVAGPLLLLVFLNLCRLGTFDPLWRDIRLCAADLNALLAPGRQSGP